MSKMHHKVYSILLGLLIGLAGCTIQDPGEDLDRKIMDGEIRLKTGADSLIGTDEFLFGAYGKIFCLDWDGTVVWQTDSLGSSGMVLCGDTLFVTTWNQSQRRGGVALLTVAGEILWQKDFESVSCVAIGGSQDLMAAGTSHKGILYAFSRDGTVLWSYDNRVPIEQVSVAPDSSCVVFADRTNSIHCVRNGELIWSKEVGNIYTGENTRTIAFSPDSSYVVYRFLGDEPQIKASMPDGEDIWSYSLKDDLSSVIVTNDSQYIIAACYKYLYMFTRDGQLIWERNIGRDNKYIATTPGVEYIVVGCIFPSRLIVLDKNGTVLWTDNSSENIFAVAIDPDGDHVAYSNRLRRLYIFLNPPE
ncbi:MAG: PQQ-binding-like beta-propeller repeat protein [Candidatus Methanofastidiosia archaeon]|jgi:hypothetical protein